MPRTPSLLCPVPNPACSGLHPHPFPHPTAPNPLWEQPSLPKFLPWTSPLPPGDTQHQNFKPHLKLVESFFTFFLSFSFPSHSVSVWTRFSFNILGSSLQGREIKIQNQGGEAFARGGGFVTVSFRGRNSKRNTQTWTITNQIFLIWQLEKKNPIFFSLLSFLSLFSLPPHVEQDNWSVCKSPAKQLFHTGKDKKKFTCQEYQPKKKENKKKNEQLNTELLLIARNLVFFHSKINTRCS